MIILDYDLSSKMSNGHRRFFGTLYYCSLSCMFQLNRFWMDDLKSLVYTIIELAGVQLPWTSPWKGLLNINKGPNFVWDQKLDFDAVRVSKIQSYPNDNNY